MNKTPNAQYNLAEPDSASVRVATRVRKHMFDMFVAEFSPTPVDEMLDIGVTSDSTFSSSNYFEALYPCKDKITAVGIDDASFLEDVYPGLKFQFANVLNLPFADGAFDYVHSSAVLEHVGSVNNQEEMVAECLRVARKGVCVTTPNRWFPIEFHTQLPFVHWLPARWFRRILVGLGQNELASEKNLNLRTPREVSRLYKRSSGWRFRIASARLLGMKSNIVLFAHRESR